MSKHRFKPFFLAVFSFVVLMGLVFMLLPTRLATAHAATTGSWPMYGYDTHHTNNNPTETIISKSNVSQLTVKWQATHPNLQWSSPVLVNNILYAVNGNFLYALNATSGKKVWSVFLGKNTYPNITSAVSNNVVYVTGSMSFMALNATTGQQIWSVPFISFGSVAPLVVNNVVYVGSTDENVYAFNAQTGTVLWKYMVSSSGDSVFIAPPTYSNGVLYVEAAIGLASINNMYALNATTGTLKWMVTLDEAGGAVPYSPTLVSGILYYMSVTTLQNGNCYDAKVGALLAASGMSRWSNTYAYCSNGALAYSKGILYFGLADPNDPYTYAYALNASDGSTKWLYKALSSNQFTYQASTPAIANGIDYIALSDNNFYAFDDQSGAILWQYTTGVFAGPPIVVNGMVYAPANTLYAFGLPGR